MCVCACAERSCVTICVCEKEKNHFMCFKFVLLLFPLYKGNTAIKGTKSAGVYSSQRVSQLCKECWMCIKSLHSLLNSHTTIVMYSTVHMYSIVDKCHSILKTYC